MAVPRAGNLEDHREESVTEPERNRLAALGYVGGAITAATTIGVGVLMGQVLIARWTIPAMRSTSPDTRRRIPVISGMSGIGVAGNCVNGT